MGDHIGQQWGDYRLVQLLGTGGFSQVYLGEHVSVGTQAAIKLLNAPVPSEVGERFRALAHTLSQIIHPHIIRVLDFGVQQEIPFLVMEYAKGGSVLKRHPRGTLLPLSHIVSYVTDLSSALHYAHEHHLVHRNLKPENILLGPHEQLWLSDCGLTPPLPTGKTLSYLKAQAVEGTLAYLSPEQFQGRSCQASDQYALAVCVYEWLTGAPPFRGTVAELCHQHLLVSPPSLCERVPAIPRAVEQVIGQALAKDPALRFADVLDFASALELAAHAITSPLLLTTPAPDHEPSSPRAPRPEAERVNPLPAPLSSFLGRREECATISALLLRQGVRLLTLTGTGGVGKTRLALAVASALHETFADGVCFVPLAATHDPEQVIPSIAQALGLQSGNRPMFEVVQASLRHKHLLLVLDNFEQVVQAASSLTDLLVTCSEVTMLVTSRETLRVDGEHEFPVLPLAVPDVEREPVEELAANPAVALFLHRARAIKPDFQLTAANAQTIASICVRLEGLPLALELAAARIKLLSPQALLSRLSHRLQVLTMGRRDAPLRQQTLRNTIQWSYDLLSVEEQTLFRRLCIFVGGCTLEAVDAIYTALDDDPAGVFDGIASLLDKNLIQRAEQEDEEPRLQVLETIREFGLECLQGYDELEQVRRAHMHYYLTWAEASRKVLFGSEQGLLIGHYIQEQWNWRAVMRLVLERADKEAALRLGGGLSVFWIIWGYSFDQVYLIEGKDFLKQALSGSEGIATTARAWALGVYGGILALLRDLETSEVACWEGLALARQVGDVQYIITGLWMVLLPLITQDDFKAARVVAEEAVSLARADDEAFTDWGAAWLLGYSLHRAGYVALWQGRYALARDLLWETIATCNQVGEGFFALWSNLYIAEADFFEGKDEEARERLEQVMGMYKSLRIRTQVAEALGFLGLLALRHGDVEGAGAQLSESMHLRQEVGEEQGLAWTEIWLARVERARQNLSEARRLLEDGLTRAIKAHSRLYTAMGLEELGRVVAAQGELVWATRLFGAAEALREAMGAPVPPVERTEYEERVAAVHAVLGEVRFRAAWAQGRSMSPQQAVSKREAAPETRSVSHASAPAEVIPPVVKAVGLTRRELDVLRLLSEGLTNAQIAERLMLSVVTVSSYLRTIYGKLGVSSRTQAMRWALDQHLF